ncbi:MAG: hypothetical protein JRC60_08545 [Deltaproteobacteria bacterium]|nr:hypothetical protein [Deltaproteobacteria bacterium]
MVEITSYGAYIPSYRLNRKAIFAAMGWFNSATAVVARGEKAAANYDEDSNTMAVAVGNADKFLVCASGFSFTEDARAGCKMSNIPM